MEWDFHNDPPAQGAENMARDEFCLERAINLNRPQLRFYEWNTPTLSLGRAQKGERELNMPACEREGVPIVRRITGGQAVLHGVDLTYSVSAPLIPPFKGGVMEIYQALSRVFVHFFKELGLNPQVKAYTGRQRVELASDICFSTPSAFEILLNGKKIVGSAQRLLPKGFLQHGSIPLVPQHQLLAKLFRGTTEDQVVSQMTDLQSEGIYPRVDGEALRLGLLDAFRAVLGGEFYPVQLARADYDRLEALGLKYPPL